MSTQTQTKNWTAEEVSVTNLLIKNLDLVKFILKDGPKHVYQSHLTVEYAFNEIEVETLWVASFKPPYGICAVQMPGGEIQHWIIYINPRDARVKALIHIQPWLDFKFPEDKDDGKWSPAGGWAPGSGFKPKPAKREEEANE